MSEQHDTREGRAIAGITEPLPDTVPISKHLALEKRMLDNFETASKAIAKQQAQIESLTAALAESSRLLKEVMHSHADNGCAEYNECDKDPCYFCERAKAAIEAAGGVNGK